MLAHNLLQMSATDHRLLLIEAATTIHEKIVSYLVARADCPLSDRISALKLCGATIVNKLDASKYPMAVQCWRRAASMQTNDCRPRLLSSPAYRGAMEAWTIRDVNGIARDPYEMEMQALLIYERVLGRDYHLTAESVYDRALFYAEEDYKDRSRVLPLFLHSLRMMLNQLNNGLIVEEEEETLVGRLQKCLVRCATLFSRLVKSEESAASSRDRGLDTKQV